MLRRLFADVYALGGWCYSRESAVRKRIGSGVLRFNEKSPNTEVGSNEGRRCYSGERSGFMILLRAISPIMTLTTLGS
jgi:hypothetical protein